MIDCPKCGHSSDEHYPRHERPTTACVVCLDQNIKTGNPPWSEGRSYMSGPGICCWLATDIESGNAEKYWNEPPPPCARCGSEEHIMCIAEVTTDG